MYLLYTVQVNESVSEEDVPEGKSRVAESAAFHECDLLIDSHCQLQRPRPNDRISGEHLYIGSVARLATCELNRGRICCAEPNRWISAQHKME